METIKMAEIVSNAAVEDAELDDAALEFAMETRRQPGDDDGALVEGLGLDQLGGGRDDGSVDHRKRGV